MKAPASANSPDVCPSCGATRTGTFCPVCGERRVESREFGLAHYVGQALAGLSTFDGRLLGSLRALILSPGRLTRDWARGARVRRLRPFQLFLLINLVTVILGDWFDLPGMSTTSEASEVRGWRAQMTEQAARLGMEMPQYDELYQARASSIARATTGVMVPVVALVSFLVRWRRERRAGVHLVLATHAVAFLLLVPDLLFVGLVQPLLTRLEAASDLGFALAHLLLLVPLVAVASWWSVADRRLFGARWLSSAWRGLVACLSIYLGGVLLHQAVVFRLTLRALE